MDSAPNKGNSAGDVPLKKNEPNKWDDFLDSLINTPLKASLHHPFHVTVVGPWVEEEVSDKRGQQSL